MSFGRRVDSCPLAHPSRPCTFTNPVPQRSWCNQVSYMGNLVQVLFIWSEMQRKSLSDRITQQSILTRLGVPVIWFLPESLRRCCWPLAKLCSTLFSPFAATSCACLWAANAVRLLAVIAGLLCCAARFEVQETADLSRVLPSCSGVRSNVGFVVLLLQIMGNHVVFRDIFGCHWLGPHSGN
jgi:hypothetical protein